MLLGKLIGRGMTAEVYELTDKNERVIKLFYERVPLEYIKKEFEASIIINQLGIPSPIVEELLKWDHKWGIIYEKIVGGSFTQIVSSNPFLLKKNALLFAELQASFHEINSDMLMNQKEYLAQNILGTNLLTKEEKEQILKYFEQLPEDTKICHGDYHSDNIILINGTLKVIDWMTGASGDPCGDVARTLMIMRYSYLPQEMSKLTKLLIHLVRKAFADFYLNSYLKLTNTSAKCIDKWMLPVMAARLVEGVHESEKQLLLKKIRQKLSSI